MEPADIDWKNIDSRFVKDDIYENINAPKWIDLSAPDSDSSLVDDEAWFCRPDCRHPKTAGDFKVKNLKTASDSEILPLGERNRRDANLKRRGLLSSSSFQDQRDDKAGPEIPRSKKPPKKLRDDGENENPNYSPIPTAKIIKASIKSSAEKKPLAKKTVTNAYDSEPDIPQPGQRTPPRRLKSTLSARNLFSGKDILNHITEFCNELKKLAVNARERENSARLSGKKKEEEPLLVEEERKALGGGGLEEKNAVAGKAKAGRNLNSNSKIFSPEAWRKKRENGMENLQVPVAHTSDNHRSNKSMSRYRSCPPSPQRFPSPYNRLKPAKTTPPKPSNPKTAERGILREREHNRRMMKEPVDEVENQNIPLPGTEEARSVDMFWFLKPCAYLGK